MNWISVSDDLPLYGARVFVWGHEACSLQRVHIGRRDSTDQNGENWALSPRGAGRIFDVTYWRPMIDGPHLNK